MDRKQFTIYKGIKIETYLGSNWAYVYFKDLDFPLIFTSLNNAKRAITSKLNKGEL